MPIEYRLNRTDIAEGVEGSVVGIPNTDSVPAVMGLGDIVEPGVPIKVFGWGKIYVLFR
jgi:hypothetical protein